jgi:hypothetical protein
VAQTSTFRSRARQHVGSGVVDPNIDRAAPLPGLLNKPFMRSRVGQIAQHHLRFHTRSAHQPGNLFCAGPIAPRVDQAMGPCARQFQRDGPPDAAGRTAHDRRQTVQIASEVLRHENGAVRERSSHKARMISL